MTGETQAAFAPAAQVVFKRGAGAGRMARDAVHRGAGARVDGVFANGVGEGAVFPVA